jgi:hypothetical protein
VRVAGDILDFAFEIRVTPKSVRVGLDKWMAILAEMAAMRRFEVMSVSDFVGIRNLQVMGVPFECDTSLEPGAFEFDTAPPAHQEAP